MRSCFFDTCRAKSRRKEKNASLASSAWVAAVAAEANSSSRDRTMASKSASLVGKWRYTVPTPTPARSATMSMGADTPWRAKTSSAASRMRPWFFRASARIGRRLPSVSPPVDVTAVLTTAPPSSTRPLGHVRLFTLVRS